MEKFGTIAVMGPANAGKSTLMNALIGQKVSIISPKPQTTRFSISGIMVDKNLQVVFWDTPGLFASTRSVDKSILNSAWDACGASDAIMIIIDSSKYVTISDNDAEDSHVHTSKLEFYFKIAADINKRYPEKPCILVLNKVDKLKDKKLLLELASALTTNQIKATFMVSAIKKQGIPSLVEYLHKIMQPGKWLYDQDQISTVPVRTLAEEFTREQIYLHAQKEVPYAVKVITDKWEETDKSVKIYQTIVVEREGQKAILLGSQGSFIKNVGQRARMEIGKLLGKPTSLFLNIKQSTHK